MRDILYRTLCAVFVWIGMPLHAQETVLSGRVCDAETGRPIPAVSLAAEETGRGTVSDERGAYQLRLAPGRYLLKVSSVGYRTCERTIAVGTDPLTADFELAPDEVAIDEVVVTGTGTEHYLKDAPVQTEVLTREAIAAFAPSDLADLLGGLTASFSFNAGEMGSGMQLNGLDNNYILILINGRRINGDVGGQNDLNRILPQDIQRIEIVKGAASSLYGSDAIAGVVNIITRKNSDRISVSNSTRAGFQYGDVTQNNSVGFRIGKWNSQTTFNLKHTDGWRNTTEEYYGMSNTYYDNSVSKTVNRSTNFRVGQALEFQATDRLSLVAEGSYYERKVFRLSGVPQWKRYDIFYRDASVSAGGKYDLPNMSYLSLDVSWDRYDNYYDYTKREYTYLRDDNGDYIVYYPGDHILQNTQERWLVQLKSVLHFGEKNTFSAGAEFLHEELISPYRLNCDQAAVYTLSLYAQDEWNITDRLNVTGGLRLVDHKDYGLHLTPKISLMYRLGDFNLRATYSAGFKSPTVKELYYEYITTLVSKQKVYYGNPDLKPQLSNYYAAGVEYNGRIVRMSATGYYNRIRNMILLHEVPVPPSLSMEEIDEAMRYDNYARARSFGADVSITVKPGRDWSIAGSYSYTDTKSQNPEDDFRYVPVNGTSYHNLSVRGTWSHTWRRYRLGVSLFGKYQSKRYYTEDGDGAPYDTWRLNTSHSLLKMKNWNLTLNLGVDNIFDYVDRTPFGRNHGTTTPGRTWYASIDVKFHK